MVKDLEVTEEPFIRNTPRRNDIEVNYRGDGSRHLPTEQYDLTISTLASRTYLEDYLVQHKGGDDRPIDNVNATVQRILASRVRRKVRNMPDRPDHGGSAPPRDNTPFVPLVLSAGGVIEEGTKEKLKEWKAWGINEPLYSWMMMVIAVRLARARARLFRQGD